MKTVLAILSALLLFQQPEAQKANGIIRGIVVNLSTGTPMEGATVTFIGTPDSGKTTTTGRDGRFEFTGLSARIGSVFATAAGFNSPRSSTPDFNDRLVSLESGKPAEVRIGLVRAFSITGTVLDENDLPISGIAVQLAQRGYLADGSPALRGARGSAQSDERGEFHISGVVPGDYQLMATRDEIMTFYPGVRFEDQAAAITVSGSDVSGMNLRLLPGSKYAIRFRLSGIDPVPAEISAQIAGGFSTGLVIPVFKTLATTADGVYTFEGILPGSHRLMIHWYEEQPPGAPVNPLARTARTVPFEIVDRDVDLGTLPVEPRVSINGRITFNAMERFPVNIILEPYPGESLNPRTSNGWISESNMFSISDIPEGRYTLRTTRLPEGSYLASAVLDNADVLGREITIDGLQNGILDLVFDSPAAGVNGVVLDAEGAPVPSATVAILPPSDRREGLSNSLVVSDEKGRFSFPNIAPGDYTAFAWQSVPQNAYRNADWLRQYEVFGARLNVRKGTTSEISLRLISQKR